MCQMESKSNQSLSGTHVGHVSPLKRKEIQRCGLVDKGNLKEANGEVTHGKEGDILLDLLEQTIWWGRGKLEKIERGKIEEKWRIRRRREKLHFLSRFPNDQTVGSGRSKRQSLSTH